MNEETKCLYGIGDKVRVVKYGSKCWISKSGYKENSRLMKILTADNINKIFYGRGLTNKEKTKIIGYDEPKNIIRDETDVWIIDKNPELVGREAIIDSTTNTQNSPEYSLNLIGEPSGKCAWYDEAQLELINKNPNNE